MMNVNVLHHKIEPSNSECDQMKLLIFDLVRFFEWKSTTETSMKCNAYALFADGINCCFNLLFLKLIPLGKHILFAISKRISDI